MFSSTVLGGPPDPGDKIYTTIVMEPFALSFGFGDSLAGICGFVAEFVLSRCENVL